MSVSLPSVAKLRTLTRNIKKEHVRIKGQYIQAVDVSLKRRHMATISAVTWTIWPCSQKYVLMFEKNECLICCWMLPKRFLPVLWCNKPFDSPQSWIVDWYFACPKALLGDAQLNNCYISKHLYKTPVTSPTGFVQFQFTALLFLRWNAT